MLLEGSCQKVPLGDPKDSGQWRKTVEPYMAETECWRDGTLWCWVGGIGRGAGGWWENEGKSALTSSRMVLLAVPTGLEARHSYLWEDQGSPFNRMRLIKLGYWQHWGIQNLCTFFTRKLEKKKRTASNSKSVFLHYPHANVDTKYGKWQFSHFLIGLFFPRDCAKLSRIWHDFYITNWVGLIITVTPLLTKITLHTCQHHLAQHSSRTVCH